MTVAEALEDSLGPRRRAVALIVWKALDRDRGQGRRPVLDLAEAAGSRAGRSTGAPARASARASSGRHRAAPRRSGDPGRRRHPGEAEARRPARWPRSSRPPRAASRIASTSRYSRSNGRRSSIGLLSPPLFQASGDKRVVVEGSLRWRCFVTEINSRSLA